MWELPQHDNQLDSIFAIDSNLLEPFSKEQFENFVAALVDKKKQQIDEIYNSSPFTFYMWFDEMAAQLRFDLLLGHAAQLPFGCIVEVVDSVEPIWQELKESYFNQGISWSELEFFEDDEDNIEDDKESYILKVYVKNI